MTFLSEANFPLLNFIVLLDFAIIAYKRGPVPTIVFSFDCILYFQNDMSISLAEVYITVPCPIGGKLLPDLKIMMSGHGGSPNIFNFSIVQMYFKGRMSQKTRCRSQTMWNYIERLNFLSIFKNLNLKNTPVDMFPRKNQELVHKT